MKRTGLIRLGGLAAMVGGVASAALGLLYVLQVRGVSLGPIQNALQKGNYENPVLTVLLFGVMAAIVALHAIQRQHYGSTGALASLVTFVGVAMTVGGSLLGELVPTMAQVAIILPIVGVPVASVGVVGLGIVTIAAWLLPWWCGVALMVGGIGFVGPMLALSWTGFSMGLLMGVPWAVVGYALLRAGSRLSEQPSRVR